MAQQNSGHASSKQVRKGGIRQIPKAVPSLGSAAEGIEEVRRAWREASRARVTAEDRIRELATEAMEETCTDSVLEDLTPRLRDALATLVPDCGEVLLAATACLKTYAPTYTVEAARDHVAECPACQRRVDRARLISLYHQSLPPISST